MIIMGTVTIVLAASTISHCISPLPELVEQRFQDARQCIKLGSLQIDQGFEKVRPGRF